MPAIVSFLLSPVGRGVIVAVAFAALVAAVAGEGRVISAQGRQIAASKRCESDMLSALAGKADAKLLSADCPAATASGAQIVAEATLCDRALSAKPADAYGVKATCTTAVKTLDAERQAEGDRADTLQSDLDRLQAGQAQAIARAEDRARTEAERTTRAQAAVAHAPVDSSGDVVCDADCLRARWSRPDDGGDQP